MLIKRKELEIFLESLQKIPKPKIEYEQYLTPSRVAANLLWFAGIDNNDIFNKIVLDLGCGSGVFAIGAAFLGAKSVIGVDIDSSSLKIAKINSDLVDVQINWICGDIRDLQLREVDTIIMNPPFGMRKESLSRDRYFLDTALKFSKIIYSINPYSEKTRDFFKKYCEKRYTKIEAIIKMDFEIARKFNFHKKAKHITQIDLYKIKR